MKSSKSMAELAGQPFIFFCACPQVVEDAWPDEAEASRAPEYP